MVTCAVEASHSVAAICVPITVVYLQKALINVYETEGKQTHKRVCLQNCLKLSQAAKQVNSLLP